MHSIHTKCLEQCLAHSEDYVTLPIMIKITGFEISVQKLVDKNVGLVQLSWLTGRDQRNFFSPTQVQIVLVLIVQMQ